MSRTLLISDRQLLDHHPGPGHPESSERLAAILEVLENDSHPSAAWLQPRPATDAEITAAHTRAHLDKLVALDAQLAVPGGGTRRLDPDTAMSPGTWRAARLCAGGAVQGVEAVWAGRATNAFVLGRPPGHHAEADRSMGFCFLNNAAIAAEAALRLGAGRVAIVDWDVHHGNGTQHMFEARTDVLYLSAHQSPFYPGTGAVDEIGKGAGRGFTVNCPLPPGQTDADYGEIFNHVFLPALQRFSPGLVLVSAGFDAHARDPLGQMRATERGFAAMCSGIADINAKLVLLLEGGYDLEALAGSVKACVRVLGGGRESFPSGSGTRVSRVIASTVEAHAGVARPLVR